MIFLVQTICYRILEIPTGLASDAGFKQTRQVIGQGFQNPTDGGILLGVPICRHQGFQKPGRVGMP